MFKLLTICSLMAVGCLLSTPAVAYQDSFYPDQCQAPYCNDQSGTYNPSSCYPQHCLPQVIPPCGTPGPCGPQGPCGECGPAGPCGPQGPQGPCGECGPPGICGPCGPRGPCGECGAPGQCGPMGKQGVNGTAGAQGPAGVPGPSGSPGAQGPQGPVGSTGPIGPVGKQGVQGPVGLQGEVGPQGPEGSQGPKGDAGLQGPRGEAGPAGLRGEVGLMGPQGISGPQGIPGEKGAKGERGCQGDCGSPGPYGPCGPTGPCGQCGPGIDAALSASTNVRQQVCVNSGISSYYMQSSVSFGGIRFDNCGIFLPSKGLYQVTYGVAVEELPDAKCIKPARFQLNLSSSGEKACVVVQGSTLSVAVPRQLATVSLLICTQTDGSYLQIQNVSVDSSNTPVPVVLNADGGVDAFINVVKLQ